MENNEKTSFSKTTPLTFIERYCSRLNINQELTKLCQFIAVRIEKNRMIPEKYASFDCSRYNLFCDTSM